MLANHEENPIAREGLSCYMARQADMYRRIIQSFMKLWSILITQAAVYTLDEGQEHEDDMVILPPSVMAMILYTVS